MKTWFTHVIFLIINFGGLAIGGLYTGKGVPSTWYQQLAKAPWTPPGWVFGVAWFIIMICFSIYLGKLWMAHTNRTPLIGWIALAWLLNVAWNPVFFGAHFVLPGLLILLALLLVIGHLGYQYFSILKGFTYLLTPYVLWLCIALSLNAYIALNN